MCGRELSYKLVVVGGGAGGCGTANKFANKLGKDQVSRVIRSSGGKFFSTLVDLEGEKREKNAKFCNWLKTHPKVLNA